MLLLIVKELMTWRWPSTAKTCSHRQTNKSRSYGSCVLTDPPTLICIKTQRGWWTWRPWYHWWDKCLNVSGDDLKILMLTTCYPCTMYTANLE